MALFGIGKRKAEEKARAEAEAKARAEAEAKAKAEAAAKAKAAAEAKAKAEKEAEKLKPVKKVYADLCHALDSKGWKYTKKEENLRIDATTKGEDLPIDIRIIVDAERRQVILLSPLPFTVPEDKRLDVSIAICAVNNMLVDGCFDYDIRDGSIWFHMNNSYIGKDIGEQAHLYMLFCSCATINKHNSKFLLLAKGMITLEKFLTVVT